MKARPAIILTDYRTGGTFLSLALDSHPLIYCCRAEPLSRTSPWWQYMAAPGPILDIIFRQETCQVAMCKLIYRHVGAGVWSILDERKAHIIHLTRVDELRAVCSFMFYQHLRTTRPEMVALCGPHVYQREPMPAPIRLEPQGLVTLMQRRATQRAKVQKDLETHGLPVLQITYEEIMGKVEATEVQKAVGRRLCEFLGVDYRPLVAPLRRVNAYPLSLMVSNWAEIEKVIQDTEFARHLEAEARWEQQGDGTWIVRN